jgi:chromosome partitioning protein
MAGTCAEQPVADSRGRGIITLAQLKGGAGRSMIAANLAACFHRDGVRTLLVDANRVVESLLDWRLVNEQHDDLPPIVTMDARALSNDLVKMAYFDVVIVDTGPRLENAELSAALSVADLVLMPVLPSPCDLARVPATLSLLQEVRKSRPDIKARIIVNGRHQWAIDAQMITDLQRFDCPVLHATLGWRTAFGEALLMGLDVVRWAPKSIAAKEMLALFDQVKTVLWQGRARTNMWLP